MKKAGIFALVIALVLLVMQFYNYRLYAYTEAACYVIDADKVQEMLARASDEEPEQTLSLRQYEAETPLYRRGQKQFIGESHDALSAAYPVYMNDGAWLYSFSDEMELIASDFSALNSYDGLYLAGGNSYNSDRELADPDEFLFLSVGGGLLMNVQPLTIHSTGRSTEIPENSLLSLSADEIRWYAYDGGVLSYGSYDDLLFADAEIGSLRMSYEALLKALGKWTDPAKKTQKEETTAQETLPEEKSADTEGTLSGAASGEGLGGAPTEEAGGRSAAAEEETGAALPEKDGAAETETVTESAASERADAEDRAAEDAGENAGTSGGAASSGDSAGRTPRETEEPTHPPYPGKGQKWSFGGDDESDGDGDNADAGSQKPGSGNSGSASGGSAGTGGSGDSGGESGGGSGDAGEEGSGGESGEGSGDSGESSGDTGGSGTPGEGGGGTPQTEKPKAALSDFSFGVYDAVGTLTVTDPQNMILKGVRVIFYKEGEGRSVYRKVFRMSGEIDVKPLSPDTEFEAEAYFDYRDASGTKQRETVLARTTVGKTLPLSALTPIRMTQEADETERFPNAIRIGNFAVSDEAPEGASPSEAHGYSAVPYIASVQMRFRKNGLTAWEGTETALSQSLLGKLRAGETISWKTAEILVSDTKYHYGITLYDRYGNALPLAKDAKDEGDAATAKMAPSAVVSIDRDTPIDALEADLRLSNPDKADYLVNSSGESQPYFVLSYAQSPDQPISFTVSGSDESYVRYPLDKDSERLTLTSLLPNTAYRFAVYGSYELNDGHSHTDVLMGSAVYTTANLSSLGTVNFYLEAGDLTDHSVTVTGRLRSRIADALKPFLTEYRLSLSYGQSETAEYVMKKEALETIDLAPGESYIIYEADSADKDAVIRRISVQLPNGEQPQSVWETLQNPNALLYAECGALHSASEYTAKMQAFAVRGNEASTGVREDVTGRYDSCTFRTLRTRACVEYDTFLANASSATFYELRVDDPDGAVTGDTLIVRLKRRANGAVTDIRSYSLSEFNQMASLRFEGLSENTEYELEILAQEYNEGFTNSTKRQMYPLYLADLSGANQGRIIFTAKDTLAASLELESMQRGFAEQSPKDGVGIKGGNLLEVNDITYGQYYDGATGVLKAGGGAGISDFIKVEQGKTYLFANGHSTIINCFDENRNFLKAYAYGNTSNMTAIAFRAPDDVAYIRMSVARQAFSAGFFSEALYTEGEDADRVNLMKTQKTEITQGAYLTNALTEVKNANAAHTDYIAIEPGRVYVRLTDAAESSVNDFQWWQKRVYFYDADKNPLTASVYVDPTSEKSYTFAAPAGARYMRVNLPAEYADSLFVAPLSASLYGNNLMESAEWTEQVYGNGFNQETAQTSIYQRYSGYIPVEATAVYEARNHAGIQVFDRNRRFLGYVSLNNTMIRMPQDAAYIRMNNTTDASGGNQPVLRKVLPAQDTDSVQVVLSASLLDTEYALGQDAHYILRVTETADGDTHTYDETYEMDGFSDRRYEELLRLAAKKDAQYTVDMIVKLGKREIVLASAEFETGRLSNVIRSEAAFAAIASAPMDDYVLTADVSFTESRDGFANSALGQNLYGRLDGQGHTLSKKNLNRFFDSVYEGAVLENLVFDVTEDTNGTPNHYAGIVMYQYGTIRNCVLNLHMQDAAGKQQDFGGICYLNNGTIENVAVHLPEDASVQNNFTAGVRENRGVLKNSYLLAKEGVKIKTASDRGNRNLRAGLCAQNRGTIENVYAVVEVEDTYAEDEMKGQSENGALVTSSNYGTMRHVFGVGSVLSNGAPPKEKGPVLAANSTQGGMADAIYYVETKTFDESHYMNNFNQRVSAASLYDDDWMNNTINGDGQFDTAAVSGGYYPQLRMPECMKGSQPLVRMPDAGQASVPRILSATVEKQEEDAAEVRFVFENRSRMEIRSIALSTRDIVTNTEQEKVYQYVPDAAAVEILEQGVSAEGDYYVRARITAPSRYRSRYYVDSYTYGIAGSSVSYPAVQEDEKQRTEIAVSFYRNIESLKDWRDAFGNTKYDNYGNYRIRTEEIDFTNVSGSFAGYTLGTFYGKLSGSFTDADGTAHTAVLKNLSLSGTSSLIGTLYGEISDLRIEGLSIEAKKQANTGLVGYLAGGTIRNVHLRDVFLSGDSNIGALVAYANVGTVTGCSATDVSITTRDEQGVYAVYAGGLLGNVRGLTMRDSYAAGVSVDALENNGLAGGIGGLAGYVETGGPIDSCYAAGSITASGQNIGGLIGYLNDAVGAVTGSFSKVDISAYGTNIGGLFGRASTSARTAGNLAVGDIVVHNQGAESVHRIAGDKSNSFKQLPDSYAYREQLFRESLAEGAVADPDDAVGLLSGAELLSWDTYQTRLGWSSEDYTAPLSSGEESGSLPMLRDSADYAFPYQEPISVRSAEASLSVESFDINSSLDEDIRQIYGQKPDGFPITKAYALQFAVHYDTEQYDVVSAAMEGMVLNERVLEKTTYSKEMKTAEDGSKYEVYRYPFLTQERGGDQYCLVLTLRKKGAQDTSGDLMLKATATPGSLIAVEIANARQWNDEMQKNGRSYGNYVLTGDIDASSLPQGEQLVMNVRLNSLTAKGGTHYFKNFAYTLAANERNVSLIRESMSELSGIGFKNCEIVTAADEAANSTHEMIGLIGTNIGALKNVSFEGIMIAAGKPRNYDSSVMGGCIAVNYGTVEDVTLKDIKVSSLGGWTGGLCGKSTTLVRRIHAEGTLSAPGKDHDASADGLSGYTSSYEVSGAFRVGGLLGEGMITDRTTVRGVHVYGVVPTQTSNRVPRLIGGIVGVGTISQAASTPEESAEKPTRIEDSVVEVTRNTNQDPSEEKQAVGGAIGHINAGTAYYVEGRNLLVLGPGVLYTGGLAGQGNLYNSSLKTADKPESSAVASEGETQADYTAAYVVTKTRVEGEQYVGGLNGYGYTYYSQAYNLDVEAGMAYAGGAVGLGSSVLQVLADKVSVKAPYGAGGIAGALTSNITNCVTSRSVIETTANQAGGIVGAQTATTGCTITNGGVLETTVTAGHTLPDADTGAGEMRSEAGGIIGSAMQGVRINDSFVRDTTVSGSGDAVGGLAGRAAGGQYYRDYTNAVVETQGSHAGGFVGELMTWEQTTGSSNAYAKALFYQNYSYAKVTAADYAGGFVGSADSDGTDYRLSADSFYSNLMLGSVSTERADGSGAAGAHADYFGTAYGSEEALSGAYLRIFEDASCNGVPAKQAASGGTGPGSSGRFQPLSDYRTKTLGGSVEDAARDEEGMKQTLLVTDAELSDHRIYSGQLIYGGMAWASFDYRMLGRMEPISQITAWKPKWDVQISYGDGGSEEFAAADYQNTAAKLSLDRGTVTAKVIVPDSEAGKTISYQWLRRFDGTSALSLSASRNTDPANQTARLAGRGYYFCQIRVTEANGGTTYYYTPTLALESEGYLPMIESGTEAFRGAQKGIDAEKTGTGEAVFYAGTEYVYDGGIPLPKGGAATQAAAAALSQADALLAALYPSGADTVNVELSAAYASLSDVTVTSGGETLYQGKPAQRVLTLPYDYKEAVQVTIKAKLPAEDEAGTDAGAPAETELTNTVRADATELRRTVAVYGDQYYYTYDGKLMSGEGLVLDEPVRNLYGGMALTADGELYSLSPDSASATLYTARMRSANAQENIDAVPIADGEADGSSLSTYLRFTRVETDGTERVQEQQLFAKNGELYAVTDGRTDRGFVLDSENGSVYLSLLNDRDRLVDLGNALKTPEGFRRSGIAHMTTSLSAEAPYVLVRYKNGTAAGFNYVTGEALSVESAVTDASLLEFAGDFTSGLFGDKGGDNTAFVDLKLLKDKLTIHPLTEAQLGAAKMYADGAVSGGDHALADDSAALDSDRESGATENAADLTVDEPEHDVSGDTEAEDKEADTGDAGEVSSEEDVSLDEAETERDQEDGAAAEKSSAESAVNTAETEHASEASETSGAMEGSETGKEAETNAAPAGFAGAQDAAAASAVASEAAVASENEEKSGSASDPADASLEAAAEHSAETGTEMTGEGKEVSEPQKTDTAHGTQQSGNTERGTAAGAGLKADSGIAGGNGAAAESATDAEKAAEQRADGENAGTKADNAGGQGTKSADEAGTKADKEEGRKQAAAEESEETPGQKPDKSETGAAGDDSGRNALRYAYAFDAKTGTADLYRRSELLAKDGEVPMSETEKLALAQKAGVLDMETQGLAEKTEKTDVQGLAAIAALLLSAVGLCILLVRRKRSDLKFFAFFLLAALLSFYAVQTSFAEGFAEANGAWYYYDASGAALKSQWVKSGDEWYYMKENGRMCQSGSEEIGGKRYFFGADGQMLTGWISDTFEEVDDTGGDAYRNGGLYYAGADGAAVIGWKYLTAEDPDQNREKQWFYFLQNGKKAVSRSIDETAENGNRYRYRFDEDGVMESAKLSYERNPEPKPTSGRWLKHIPSYSQDPYASDFSVERWYYLTAGEKLVKDQLRTINGEKYLFDQNGIMKTGLCLLTAENKYEQTLVQSREDIGIGSEELRAYDGKGKLMYFDESSGKAKSGEIRLTLSDGEYTLGIGRNGTLWHGEKDGKLYDRGLRVEADSDLRYEIAEVDGRSYLVGSGGRIMGQGSYTDGDSRRYTVVKTNGAYQISVS